MKRFIPGVSFGDFVISDMKKVRARVREENRPDYRRAWLVWILILMAFGVLAVRLAELQLFRGGTYGVLADENRIKRIKVPADRGTIYDRNGSELAAVVHKIVRVQDGLEVEGWQRSYPLGIAAAHVVGYLGEVDKDEVGLLKEAGQKYEGGDWTGRMGLELAYEERLRGVDGGRLIEVDNMGKLVRELGKKAQVAGARLDTTIDADLQRVAWEAVSSTKGSVVVSNPKTGEVLALVSAPGFDPNQVGAQYSTLSAQGDMPFFDRSIGGLYPPGSTFKMVTMAAALESGRVKRDFTYMDTGVIEVGGFSYTNWLFTKRGEVEGVVGFVKALARSTDTFFYKIGEMTGPTEIEAWAKKFGLGINTGISLPGEVEGLIATPEWKERVRGEKWFLGNTYHMAIGQGDVLVTPVQVNVMTNALANKGIRCRPILVKGEAMKCEQIEMSEEVREIIQQGMVEACSQGGTSFVMFDWNEAAKMGMKSSYYARATQDSFLPVIACKTGTAEYVAENGKTRTHGWLTAYAPVDDPVISVTVVIEGGGEGSNVAAPVVRKILAKYFEVEDLYNYGAIPQTVSE